MFGAEGYFDSPRSKLKILDRDITCIERYVIMNGNMLFNATKKGYMGWLSSTNLYSDNSVCLCCVRKGVDSSKQDIVVFFNKDAEFNEYIEYIAVNMGKKMGYTTVYVGLYADSLTKGVLTPIKRIDIVPNVMREYNIL